MQVNLSIELPEDVSKALQKKWGDLSKRTLKTFAIDGYRSGALSVSQVRRMLGFHTRMEVHEFLKSAGVYRDWRGKDPVLQMWGVGKEIWREEDGDAFIAKERAALDNERAAR